MIGAAPQEVQLAAKLFEGGLGPANRAGSGVQSRAEGLVV